MFLSDKTMSLLVTSGLEAEKLVEILQSLRADEDAARPVRSSSAERQARYRHNKAQQTVTDVTPVADSDVCHAAVTPALTGAQVVIPSLPSLRSEELKIPPEKPSVSTPKGAKPRGSKLVPANWSPSAETRRVLTDEGHDAGSMERALTMMRDHEFRVPRTDWDKTFRNWVREDTNRQPRKAHERPHNPERSTPREDRLGRMLRGAMAAVDEREADVG